MVVLLVHVLFVDDISPCALNRIAAFCAAGADCWGRDGVDGMCAGTGLGDGIAGWDSGRGECGRVGSLGEQKGLGSRLVPLSTPVI